MLTDKNIEAGESPNLEKNKNQTFNRKMKAKYPVPVKLTSKIRKSINKSISPSRRVKNLSKSVIHNEISKPAPSEL